MTGAASGRVPGGVGQARRRSADAGRSWHWVSESLARGIVAGIFVALRSRTGKGLGRTVQGGCAVRNPCGLARRV
jgi:hypothetical protein